MLKYGEIEKCFACGQPRTTPEGRDGFSYSVIRGGYCMVVSLTVECRRCGCVWSEEPIGQHPRSNRKGGV